MNDGFVGIFCVKGDTTLTEDATCCFKLHLVPIYRRGLLTSGSSLLTLFCLTAGVKYYCHRSVNTEVLARASQALFGRIKPYGAALLSSPYFLGGR